LFLSLLQAEVAGGDSKGFLAEAILEARALTGRRQRGGVGFWRATCAVLPLKT